MAVIEKIYNGDGTVYNPPKNPLHEKWNRLYNGDPEKQCSSELGFKENGTPIMNYSCVLCHNEKCIHSNNFKVPDEDKEEFENFRKIYNEYLKSHNPFFRNHGNVFFPI